MFDQTKRSGGRKSASVGSVSVDFALPAGVHRVRAVSGSSEVFEPRGESRTVRSQIGPHVPVFLQCRQEIVQRFYPFVSSAAVAWVTLPTRASRTISLIFSAGVFEIIAACCVDAGT